MLKLRSYQEEGVAFLVKSRRALLTDDPGLGKTAQTLSAIGRLEAKGVVVVCPAVVLGVWREEVAKWLPGYTVRIQATTKPVDPPGPKEVLVTSYSRANLHKGRYGVLVCDESHMLKSSTTQRTKRCAQLAKRASRVWLLTGTPILKDPIDLWNQLSFLGVERGYQNFTTFVHMFGGYRNRLNQLEWSTPTKAAWKPCCHWHLGRKREDVLDLPDRVFENIFVPLPKRAATKFAEIAERYPEDDDSWQKWSSGGELATALADYSAVKAAGVLTCLKDYSPSKQSPVILFSAHQEAAKGLSETLNWPLITGSTPSEERAKIADDFQAGKYEGLVATITAAGVGLTLTRASTAIFVSRTFVPALNSQAADRIYRIGQKQSVRVIYVRADSPLEWAVDKVLRRKQPYMK